MILVHDTERNLGRTKLTSSGVKMRDPRERDFGHLYPTIINYQQPQQPIRLHPILTPKKAPLCPTDNGQSVQVAAQRSGGGLKHFAAAAVASTIAGCAVSAAGVVSSFRLGIWCTMVAICSHGTPKSTQTNHGYTILDSFTIVFSNQKTINWSIPHPDVSGMIWAGYSGARLQPSLGPGAWPLATHFAQGPCNIPTQRYSKIFKVHKFRSCF